MKPQSLASICLAGALAYAGVSAGAVTSSSHPGTATKPRPATARPVAGSTSGGFLADSVVLARVDGHTIRVRDYVDGYFNAEPQYRPKGDSLSRAEFLRSMINKEILASTALEIGKPLGFEDRATLREHSDRVLSNVLYQRMVIDSVQITDADIQHAYAQFKYEVHLKHIQLPDRPTAERVRSELLGRHLPWSVAVRKYSVAADKDHDGDMGWHARLGMTGAVALEVWDLKPGELSQPIEDPQGFHIIQVVERRAAATPALEPLRGIIRDQLVGVRAGDRQLLIQQRLLSKVSVHYDDANIAWAATLFQRPVSMNSGGAGPSIEINPNMPEVIAADHDRVLAKYSSGQVTMDQLLHAYEAMPTMLRPSLTTPAAVKAQVDAVILEPTMIQLAHEHGLDKDPLAVDLIRKKEEEIRVEHLFQDSIQSRVTVTAAMRKKYYEDNKKGFFTYPYVRYAAFSAHSKSGVDSLKARLAKEKASSILYADSLAGVTRGSIQERYQNQHGPYQKVLFEELRPGQTMVDGPDKNGDFILIQLLAFDPGHQLSYAEVEKTVDESVQGLVADDMLNRFIARHQRGHKIESHPELVMRIRLAPQD